MESMRAPGFCEFHFVAHDKGYTCPEHAAMLDDRFRLRRQRSRLAPTEVQDAGASQRQAALLARATAAAGRRQVCLRHLMGRCPLGTGCRFFHYDDPQ